MEQVGGTVTDADKKVERILKLLKRRNRGKREPELVELIQDFHKQYQSLYGQYDHLRQESGQKAPDGKGNEGSSHSPSSSDSEYYSSEDIDINTDIAPDKRRSFPRRPADNIKEELERAYAEVAALKQQLASKTEEKKALASEHLAALTKVKEIETTNGSLRKEVDEKVKRLTALGEVHKGRVTELEEQLTGLKTELECLHHQKRDLEAQVDGKTAETKQQGEISKALYMQSSEFELIPPVKGDEINELMRQIQDNENNFTSKLEDSMAQVSNLKKEVEHLLARQCEAKDAIACKSNESLDKANIMKQELDSLRSQKTELETLLEKKSEEISQCLIQVKSLEEELASKSAIEQKMVEEKEGLQVQIMDLKSEVNTLCKQKNRSEEEVKSSIGEINRLREEKSKLEGRVLGLDAVLQEKGLELFALQEDSKSQRLKDDAQIMTLKEEVKLLQQKLQSLETEKSQLESQIAEQNRITKEREESVNKPTEESTSTPVRKWSSGSKSNNQTIEKKMEDLADEFRNKVEDNIRLLYQRIKVAEKIHFENKETYKQIKDSLEQENVALKDKLATCEAEFRKLRDSMEPGKKAVPRSSSAVNKSEEGFTSPARFSNDCDMKQLKSNVNLVVAELDKQKESLEAKLSEQGEEKLKLMKEVSELESRVRELEMIMKEKDETLLGLEEEKREAIRQLCLMSELESRVGELKRVMKEKDETLLGLEEEKQEAIRQLCLMSELEGRVGELEMIMKEKDEILLSLQEEKREAIRQLCLLIDYHRGRCDTLMELISKLTLRSKKKK